MISAIPMQSATLHRFHSTTAGLHPTASPLASWSTQAPIDRSRRVPFIQEGFGAWDITPDARPAFCFYQPFRLWLPSFGQIDPGPIASCLTRQEPIPTFRSSDGCLTLRPTKSARRFALSDESAVFQSFVVCLPSHPTRRRTFTLSINAVPLRLVVRTWLPKPRTPTLPDQDSIFQDTHSQV
jgi:hypothetical protein